MLDAVTVGYPGHSQRQLGFLSRNRKAVETSNSLETWLWTNDNYESKFEGGLVLVLVLVS